VEIRHHNQYKVQVYVDKNDWYEILLNSIKIILNKIYKVLESFISQNIILNSFLNVLLNTFDNVLDNEIIMLFLNNYDIDVIYYLFHIYLLLFSSNHYFVIIINSHWKIDNIVILTSYI
jgi:hypothetical protein